MAEQQVQPVEDHSNTRSGLEDIDTDTERRGRLPFILSKAELKLLGIAGVGFFLDAYDLFVINQVSVMLQFRLYGGKSLPSGLEGIMKAGANIGCVVGQILFGYLADNFGRKAVYGKELMVIIIATILCIAAPTGKLSPDNVLVWITCFRVLLGIGIGGDYPLSASVMADRAKIWKRGSLLAFVFTNQGYGSLVGSIVTMIVLACYKDTIEGHGHVSKVDGAWRIVVGLSLIPAFGTLYQRLVLPEAERYNKAQQMSQLDSNDELALKKGHTAGGDSDNGDSIEKATPVVPVSKKEHFREFCAYMSEWRHLKILIGTAACWFLVDIAFYGINLNQSVVLQQIHFDGKNLSPWHKLFKIATGNLIITALGFVPGYWVSTVLVEYIGRKPIQLGGFLAEAFFLAILAGKFHTLSTASFIAIFTLLQFFFNFGANLTTFLYPAEVFPTKFRSTAHGISAASGKCGAIISSLAFNVLSKKAGTPVVLWIFFGVSILGAFFTLLLPEVKGRDPDEIYRLELEEARRARSGQ
ncbi:inorganic phosphate transporter [Auriculariales sp. MPI-PUGE-AT-0066]|nr:inorganic phosphate transporter [Auriculariales sp. MPI-PUGE-AT-0066]